MAALTGQGIAEKDLQTTNFSVQPRYVYPKRSSTGEQAPPRIAGYDFSNQLIATIRNFDDLGAILDSAVSTGSNQIHGLQFSIDKPGPLRDEARKLAVARAMKKAAFYSEAAALSWGRS